MKIKKLLPGIKRAGPAVLGWCWMMFEKAKPIALELWKRAGVFYRRRPRVAIGLLAGLIILAVLGRGCSKKAGDGGVASMLYKVVRAPLTISVTETGTIENREKIVIRSQVQGAGATIILLVEEGKAVEKGDLLVEMDSSGFEDSKTDAQIQVENGSASVVRARETFEVTKNQAAADIEKAGLNFKFAKLALEKYREGEYPEELQNAQADITIAKEEVRRSEEKLAWSQKLASEDFITRSELQADELALKRDQINLQMAENKLTLLEKYTHMEKVEKLQSDVKQAELALDRETRKARADILQAEVDLHVKEVGFSRQQDKMNKIMDQIKNCRIIAPAAGMVVYASSMSSGRRHGGQEPLAVGKTVNEREELIYLPTTGAMNVEFQVQEASLTKVSVGNDVRVTVHALTGMEFRGRLSKIAVLPDASQSFWNPALKVYNCQIELSPPTEGLRPGMSCNIEIVVQELKDVVYVPIQSVLRVNGTPTVYVMGMMGPAPRAIKTGLDNNRMIHVIEGLEKGEKVLLSPPLKAGERNKEEELSADKKSVEKEIPVEPSAPVVKTEMPAGQENKPGTADENSQKPERRRKPGQKPGAGEQAK